MEAAPPSMSGSGPALARPLPRSLGKTARGRQRATEVVDKLVSLAGPGVLGCRLPPRLAEWFRGSHRTGRSFARSAAGTWPNSSC